MTLRLSQNLQALQAPTETAPLPFNLLRAARRLLESWFAAWAVRAEARWKTTELRSRYY